MSAATSNTQGNGWLIVDKGKHVEVTMNSNKVNAISTGFLADWEHALSRLRTENAFKNKPVVLRSHNSKVFCAGLNLVEMYKSSRKEIAEFLVKFGQVLIKTIQHPTPVIAAVNGHSIAGGVVISACCDIVVAAEGDYRYTKCLCSPPHH